MKQRGLGRVYQPVYTDKKTGERKRSSVWWIQFCRDGRVHRESSDSQTEEKARGLLAKRLEESQQETFLPPDARRTTVNTLAKMILTDYRTKGKRSIGRVEDAVEHLKDFFGNAKVINLTSDHIAEYVEKRQEEGAANGTVNRELSALKRMLTLGVKARKVIYRPSIEMLDENNVRKGFFEAEQFNSVYRHLPADLKAPVEVAYLTGWRIHSEILTRQKHHVDLQSGWLRLEPGETKNGQGRMFPLIPRLKAVLTEQLERTRELEKATGQIIPWLFHRDGKPIKSFRRAWITACRKAGVPGRIPHDFRRTAVRNLERAAVPRSSAMKMVGHETENVYRRYAISDETMLKEAGAKLAAFHDSDQKKASPKSATGF